MQIDKLYCISCHLPFTAIDIYPTIMTSASKNPGNVKRVKMLIYCSRNISYY